MQFLATGRDRRSKKEPTAPKMVSRPRVIRGETTEKRGRCHWYHGTEKYVAIWLDLIVQVSAEAIQGYYLAGCATLVFRGPST